MAVGKVKNETGITVSKQRGWRRDRLVAFSHTIAGQDFIDAALDFDRRKGDGRAYAGAKDVEDTANVVANCRGAPAKWPSSAIASVG